MMQMDHHFNYCPTLQDTCGMSHVTFPGLLVQKLKAHLFKYYLEFLIRARCGKIVLKETIQDLP